MVQNIESIIEDLDRIKEFDDFIDDYLNSTDTNNSNIIKNTIIQKIIDSNLSYQDLKNLRDSISQRWQNEVWSNKMKLYELTAWIYNNVWFNNQNTISESKKTSSFKK